MENLPDTFLSDMLLYLSFPDITSLFRTSRTTYNTIIGLVREIYLTPGQIWKRNKNHGASLEQGYNQAYPSYTLHLPPVYLYSEFPRATFRVPLLGSITDLLDVPVQSLIESRGPHRFICQAANFESSGKTWFPGIYTQWRPFCQRGKERSIFARMKRWLLDYLLQAQQSDSATHLEIIVTDSIENTSRVYSLRYRYFIVTSQPRGRNSVIKTNFPYCISKVEVSSQPDDYTVLYRREIVTDISTWILEMADQPDNEGYDASMSHAWYNDYLCVENTLSTTAFLAKMYAVIQSSRRSVFNTFDFETYSHGVDRGELQPSRPVMYHPSGLSFKLNGAYPDHNFTSMVNRYAQLIAPYRSPLPVSVEKKQSLNAKKLLRQEKTAVSQASRKNQPKERKSRVKQMQRNQQKNVTLPSKKHARNHR